MAICVTGGAWRGYLWSFYDDHALVEEMVECLTHLALGLLKRVLAYEVSWRGYDIVSLKNLTDYQPLMPRYNKYSVKV